MGLFDNISGSLGGMISQVTAAAAPGLISAVLAKTNLGDMQGIVNQLQQNGLGAQVQSWLGNGSNLPVTQIAEHFGVPVDQALKLLADHLPAAVDQASPNGTVEAQ
jgi:uncharacterized protein YidB (DUF937 family)